MHRAIVLSVIAVLSTASDAVAQDATAVDAPAPLPPTEAAPAGQSGKPAAKPARPKRKGGPLPRLDLNRDRKEFQRKLALAQDLHVQDRCGAAYVMYLELQKAQPQNPDALWGLGECGRLTAQFPELGIDAQRQRALDAKAAYEAYAAAEKRPQYLKLSGRVALARERASQLEVQIAALPAAGQGGSRATGQPSSAPESREFPKHKDTLVLCGMQAFWDPDQGLNPAFAVELFALLHADPELRAMIWLPADWNDRARRLFQATNDLSLKDPGFRDRHGFKPAILREYASYEKRIGFVGTPVAETQQGRVTLHHPNGIDVTVVRCDAVRGALAWAVEEKQRRASASVRAGAGGDRSVALAIAGAGQQAGVPPPEVAALPPPAALPPAPPLVEGEGLPAEAPAPVAATAPPPARELSLGHAQALAKERNFAGALAELEELLRRHPDHLDLQEHWVLWRATSEQCEGVMPAYERIAERSQRPEVHAAGSECADRVGDTRAHLSALERYVRTVRYVGDPMIYFSLAESFAALGDRQRAGMHFKQYLARLGPTGGDPAQRAAAEAYVRESQRARTDCLVQAGVATAQLVPSGSRWVVQVRIPQNALEQAPTCGE